MFWTDQDTSNNAPVVPDNVVDLSFAVRGEHIPSDYAHALCVALQHLAPWLTGAPVGVHLYLVAEAANGWYREDQVSDTLYLPKRARLNLRAPKHYIERGQELVGRNLQIQQHLVRIGDLEIRRMSPIRTQYARHVASHSTDEEEFLRQFTQDLHAIGARCNKVLCGKTRQIWTPGGIINTRSVMLAELSHEDAVNVQRHGIGPHRQLGCGIFVPHKSI